VQVEFRALDFEMPGFDLGEVENVVDNGKQRFAGAAYGFDAIALGGIEISRQEHGGHADDSVQRRADFMAHGGQEIAFLAGGYFRFASSLQRPVDQLVQLGRMALQVLARGFHFEQVLQHLGFGARPVH
jgi:hypothetical protein